MKWVPVIKELAQQQMLSVCVCTYKSNYLAKSGRLVIQVALMGTRGEEEVDVLS